MESTIYELREQDGLINGSEEIIKQTAAFLDKHNIPYTIIPSGYFKGIKLTRANYYKYMKLESKKK